MVPSRYLCLALFLLCGHLASAQTVVNSTFIDALTGTYAYGNPNNWSPAEVPNNTATRQYNVTIPQIFYVIGDTDATVSNLTLAGFFDLYNKNFVVTGATAMEGDPGSAALIVDAVSSPASFNAGKLTSFSGGTLRGYYVLSGFDQTATLQFDGANINALGDNSSLILSGPLVRVIDENGNDALRNLTRVESSAHLTLGGSNRATSVPFTNLGEITLGTFFEPTIFEAVGGSGNFDPGTRTISGGSFVIGQPYYQGQTWALAEFRFPDADVVNNGSSIQLAGPLSRMADLAGNDGLRGLAHNLASGSLTFDRHDFTTAGTFANDGSLTLLGSQFTTTGGLSNFDPATRTLSGGSYSISSGGILKFPGADIVRNAATISLSVSHITDLAGNDALRNFDDNLAAGSFTVGKGQLFVAPGNFTNAGRLETIFSGPAIHEPIWESGEFRLPAGSTYTQTGGLTVNGGIFTAENINISGGSFAGRYGAIKGNLTVSNGTVSAGGTIDGNLTLGAQAHVHATIGQYYFEEWSDITGAASLNGTLEIELIGPVSLSSENEIEILHHAGSVTGTFSNAPPGARITTVDGTGSFVVVYEPDKVKLTDFRALPPPAQLLNISTRALLSRADDDPYGDRGVLIGGFIISGAESKKVVVRGLGPSLTRFGLSPALSDPTLELHRADGAIIATNDNWADSQGNDLTAIGLAPDDPREAALVATLPPDMYTVVIREKNGLAGYSLVEIYDVAASSNSKVGNISTRGFSDEPNPLIGGIIAGGDGPANAQIVVRAIGPQLRRNGIFNALEDPTLEVRDANGGVVAFNDDWFANYEQIPGELQPYDSRESALRLSLPRGNYTALVRPKPNSSGGVALVEFYDLRR
jgi:hypothetical protein